MQKKIDDVALIVDPFNDNVAIAKKDLFKTLQLVHEGDVIELKDAIGKGHRFAVRSIRKGEPVRQYGYSLGRSKGVTKGERISLKNIKSSLAENNLDDVTTPCATNYRPQYTNRSFKGYLRADGRVGTRNYYLIVPTSMCASETALQLAAKLETHKDGLKKHSNIDGIVAVPHTEGCGCAANEQIDRVMRVLKGYIMHPNVGGCLIIDLGCEQTNYEKVYSFLRSDVLKGGKPTDWLTIQDCGGTGATIKKGFSIGMKQLPKANNFRRSSFPVERLVVGTQCGASDSFSGITANPVIGDAVDKIIYGKGSAILSEIPELLGIYELLAPRFRNKMVAQRFLKAVTWYDSLAKKLKVDLKDNLVPKNKEGGLINITTKSLGAAMKGGSTVIEDVIDYGAPLKRKGLTIMQGPGGDLESMTGIVASGATVVCFSTGKGTTTGNAVCPSIKVASTDELARALPEDIDFNAGRLLTKNMSRTELGEALFEMILRVASGEKTWSEKWKQRQFQIWTAGKLSM